GGLGAFLEDVAVDGGAGLAEALDGDAVVGHQAVGLLVEVEDGGGQRVGGVVLQAPQAGAAGGALGLQHRLRLLLPTVGRRGGGGGRRRRARGVRLGGGGRLDGADRELVDVAG